MLLKLNTKNKIKNSSFKELLANVEQADLLDSFPEAQGNLTIDLYETPEQIVVKGLLPGVKPEDIEIDLKEKFLHIKAERKRESEVDEKNYYFKESEHGELERSIRLHKVINPSEAQAIFEHGVLTIFLPKVN